MSEALCVKMSKSKEGENIHHCKENFYDDVAIQYQQINVEQSSWVIRYTWYATQSEVDDGIADEVGSIIMSDTLLISFCPFCGRKLVDIKENTW